MLKRFLKNERGLTLIELLAVVVILGIIAAIAVPSIGGLIDNSKKDAHIANSQQIANATKTYLAAQNITIGTTAGSNTKTVYLKQLIAGGYLDKIKDPNGTFYYSTDSEGTSCTVTNGGTTGYTYNVTLVGAGGTVDAPAAGKTYITNKDVNALTRTDVTLP